MPGMTHQAAHQQLQALDSDVRLVIVNPSYVGQRQLLHLCLQDDGCVYFRFEDGDIQLGPLMARLENALAHQQPDGMLAEIHQLILDEWDRVPPAEIELLVLQLLEQMNGGRIILMGRGVPRFVYDKADIRQKTRLIPTDATQMLLDYTQRDGKVVMVEVYALGRGAVAVNGRSILDWGGDLPRSLFFYLVDKGIATRSDIFKAFWPDLPTREATNVFHVTKRKISEVLGIDLTTYWSGFYRISPQIELMYDVSLFAQVVQDSAVVSKDEMQRLLSDAVSFYHGDYLYAIDEHIPWVQKRRHELKQVYTEALTTLARLAEESEEKQTALGLYVRAFATHPHREDIASRIISLYDDLGLYEQAAGVYKRLESELSSHLHISPAHALQRLAAAIQAKADRKA